MPELTVPLDALLLMFVLGLRHGLDPDHIAMVDSLTFSRSGMRQPAWWSGTMFAAGHGAAVTVAAIVMQSVSSELALAAPWTTLFAWLPVALLFIAGSANLRSLLHRGQYRPTGSAPLLLARLCTSAHPSAAFAIGILFALVFDTASQLAAYGYTASAGHGPAAALLMGIAFTTGMVIVDALDGYLMHRLLANPDEQLRQRYRRRVGWLTVIAAFGVAGHGAASHLWPGIDMDESTLTTLGAAMVAAFVLLGCLNYWQGSRSAAP